MNPVKNKSKKLNRGFFLNITYHVVGCFITEGFDISPKDVCIWVEYMFPRYTKFLFPDV